jgi:YVTN family beta-propeller protein
MTRSLLWIMLACGLLSSTVTGAVRLTHFSESGQPIQWYWPNAQQGIPFVIHDAGSRSLSQDATYTTLRRAFQTWATVATAFIKFSDAGLTDQAVIGNDGVNRVFFDTDGSQLNLPEGTGVIAATFINDVDETGAIIDADIVFNNREYTFSTNGNYSSNIVDLEGVAVHEIGHFLGLDHSPISATPAVTPTMYPYVAGALAIEARTLEPDDISGVSDIYSTAGFLSSTGSIAGKVLRPDGLPVFGAHVAALNPITGHVIVSGLSGYRSGRSGQGEFRLPGLPPGDYALSITPVTGDVDETNLGGIFKEFDTNFTGEYFENATSINTAQTLTVTAGDSLTNLQFVTGIFAPGYPEIVPAMQQPNTFDHASPYEVSVSIIDNVTITDRQLLYRMNGGATARIPLTMQNTIGKAAIPPQPVGTTVSYAFEVTNENGLTSRWPAGDAWLEFTVLPLPAAALAYVAMRESGSIAVINTDNRAQLAEIFVGRDPLSLILSPDQRRLYALNRLSNSLSVINTSSHHTIATVPTGDGPIAALLSPDNHWLYVLNSETSVISVIETATLTTVRTMALESEVGPSNDGRLLGFAMAPDGSRLYMTDIIDSRCIVVDPADGQVLHSISTVASPRWVTLSPNGGTLYVTSFDGAGIHVIDAGTMQPITTIGTFPANSTFAMTVSADGARGYASDYATGNLVVLDLTDNTLVEVLSTEGVNPRNVTLSPDGSLVYVSNQDSDNIFVLDTATLTNFSLIDAAAGPRSILFGIPTDVPTSITDLNDNASQPKQFGITRNYPNPFNPATTIEFQLPVARHVQLDIFDILGRRVRRLVDQHTDAGIHRLTWDATNQAGQPVAGGVYFAALRSSDNRQAIRKVLLLR